VGAQLTAGDGTALGELVAASESFDSVCNSDGSFGSPFSPTSIFNPDSEYGGDFGPQSPFNADSTQPPAIVLAGETLAYLTLSPIVADPVDPERLLTWLGCYGEAG
jgi:hypothetical protein